MSVRSIYTPNIIRTFENGYSWYECDCCPYGYHIDLDFVRYCESVGQETVERSGSSKCRKDQRKQRQSMEVLLGLTPSELILAEPNFGPIYDQTKSWLQLPLIPDAFTEAITDVEQILPDSKHSMFNNLPDVAGVTENIECGVQGPLALQHFREQLTASLERTKMLEDQVNLIPDINKQLDVLMEKNKYLRGQLKSTEAALNNLQASNVSFREKNLLNMQMNNKSKEGIPPSTKDFGAMCGVLARSVGVGHQNPNTTTFNRCKMSGQFTDKWFNEKVKFMNIENTFQTDLQGLQCDNIHFTKSTQTVLPREMKDVAIQLGTSSRKEKKITLNCSVQTIGSKKIYSHVGILVKPQCSDFAEQKFVDCYSVGCSDDKVDDITCKKCNLVKRTIGVGPENSYTSPMSLASLTVKRSKSFNLGYDRLNLSTKNKTVACQYESNLITRGCQYEITTLSKSCQPELKFSEKYRQYEPNLLSKSTDTKELIKPKKHVGCQVKESKSELISIGCNTVQYEDIPCDKCMNREEQTKDRSLSPTPTRIPRLQIPRIQLEVKKSHKYDTYPKVHTSPVEMNTSTDTSEQSFVNGTQIQESIKQNTEILAFYQKIVNLPVPEKTETPVQHRNRRKIIPSKEVEGAMKVLNDTIQKNQPKSQQSDSAVNLVQEEWFKISSLALANPLDVEDYLDAFEDVSHELLQCIANMSDASGNTTLHYAVSHGNFDVVSILLNSKVCNVNKQNKAGYTSVMLVSLAEVRSPSDVNVIRRLFQIADANVRAREHGQTALMLAVSHGRLDIVRMLLEAGADVNIQDEDGSTSLMCAAEHGHVEIVKYFLNHPECDSTITDVDGSTALKIAMEAGHRHIGVLLYAHERNYGAKVKKSKLFNPKALSLSSPTRHSRRALTDLKATK